MLTVIIVCCCIVVALFFIFPECLFVLHKLQLIYVCLFDNVFDNQSKPSYKPSPVGADAP